MNIRQTVRIPRRVLSLALCAAMVLTLLPLPARAEEGICAHHPEHTADCGYQAAVEGQACSHVCGEACYTVATDCQHNHDASCYSDGVLPVEGEEKTADACTHACTEESGCVTKAHTCVHTDHEGCGFVAAVAGSPCTYRCEICAQQQNAQDLCTHGNDPAACEACASDARVASVQKLIDALPETVTEETAEAAQSALSAVDTAKAALTEAEQEKLNLARYTALKELLAEPESPNTGKVITDWTWVDPDEWLEEDGSFIMPGVTEDSPAYFEDVVEYLPLEVTTDAGEVLTLGDWSCDDYPRETGTSQGEFVFTTTLPEGYILSDGSNVLRLNVTVAPMDLSEGPEATGYATVDYMTWNGTQLTPDSCNNATEVTGSTEDVTWSAGWYVVNQDVTFGTMMKPVAVRAEGDIHLILADGATCTIYGRLEVNSSDGESDSLTIYGQSGQSGALNVQNVSHYYCATNGADDGCSDPTNKTNIFTSYSAAIGSKCKGPETEDYASYDTKITINGGNVNASFVAYDHIANTTGTPRLCWPAAIGGGPFANATITINGGTVNGNNPDIGAGIGAGRNGNCTVVINGGTVEGYSEYGAGIGGSTANMDTTATITINGGKVTGRSSVRGAGIGSGSNNDNSARCQYATIYINGGEVTGDGSEGAGIGSGYKSNTASIEISGGTVTGDGGAGAGIGSGSGAYQATINITDGIVKARAGKGAAIGSGNEARNNSTKITITGGDISASTENHNESGAAIGGSYSGNKVSKIEIRNAKVVARAGKGSPGIGDGSVTISNSTVEAYGGQYAAGIGSRQRKNSDAITIEGSNVTAVGGTSSAGIGTADFNTVTTSALGKITITGGTVYARGSGGAAGIGGGTNVMVNSGDIEISGGTVYACRGRGPLGNEQMGAYQPFDIGDGELPTSSNLGSSYCKFTLPENGTAWVYLESDNTRKNINQISGVVLEKKQSDGGYETCTVYGAQNLSADYPIASGRSMTVTSGATLSTGNYGIYVQNGGTLTRTGTVNGNIYYPLTLIDCAASGNTATYGDSNELFGKAGATISLTPALEGGYKLDSWTVTPSSVSVSDYSFKMPNEATTVKANVVQAVRIDQQPTADQTIIYGADVTLSVAAQNPSGDTDGIAYQWYQVIDGKDEKLSGKTENSLTLTKPNAGTYSYFCRVTWDGISIDSNTATVTVKKATGSVTINNDPGKPYDGQHAFTGYTVTGSGNVIIEYKVKDAADSTYTEIAPTNAGSYTVRVTLPESQNYTGAFNTRDFTISKATNNEWLKSPAVTDFTYGTTVTSPVTYEAKYGNDKVQVTYKKQGTEDTPSTDVPKDAGTYDVTVSLAETDNYSPALAPVNLTLTISKAASSVIKKPEDAKSLYTGNPVPLVNAGTAAGGNMHYSLDGTNWSKNIPTATECGTYTVYYKVVGDNNHNDTEAWTLTAKIVPFRIHSQPQPDIDEIEYGTSIKRSVGLQTNVTEGISYQWCLVTREDGNKEIFTPLEGETGKELTLTKPNAGKYEYACIVTCGDYSETSAKATVTVTPVDIPVDSGTGIDLSGFWLEGGEAPASENQTKIPEKSPSSRLLTKYTYNGASADAHQNYPTGMQIYSVETDDQGNTTVAPVAELGNLLRYSGCSIRITGKPGIRMITSLTKEAKTALTKANLAGYTLEEYGTVAVWSSDLDNQPLTLNTKKSRSNYAYKRGVSDPVFANVGALTQYTNVLVWDSLEAKKYDEDIVMRPYIKLINKEGETVVLYGGTVSRSIGYVAQQNANTFTKGTAGYKYVHEIIDKVNALHSSTGTNTTTGGNG